MNTNTTILYALCFAFSQAYMSNISILHDVNTVDEYEAQLKTLATEITFAIEEGCISRRVLDACPWYNDELLEQYITRPVLRVI